MKNNKRKIAKLEKRKIGISKKNSRDQKNIFLAMNIFCYSDKNLKEDLDEYTDGLDKVMKIRPVSYEYNGKAGTDPNKKHVGIIAQEMKEIAPYMVDFDENGEYLQYNSGALSYMLVNATQTQQKYIEQLQLQMKEMQKNIESLQKRVEQLS